MAMKSLADKLYSKLEKDEKGYYRRRRVAPVLDEEGNIIWFNLITGGSWWRLLGVILFVLIALGFINEYYNNFKLCADVLNQMNNITLYPVYPGGQFNITITP